MLDLRRPRDAAGSRPDAEAARARVRNSLKILITAETRDPAQAIWLGADLRGLGHTVAVALAGPGVPQAAAQLAQEHAVPVIPVSAPEFDLADYDALERAGQDLARIAREFEPDIVHAASMELAGFLSEWPLLVEAGPGPLTWWPAVRGTEAPASLHWRRHLAYRGLGMADTMTAPTEAHAAAVFARLRGLGEPAILPDGHAPLDGAGKDAFALAIGGCWSDPGGCPALLHAGALSNWVILAGGPGPVPHPPGQPVAHITWIGDAPSQVRHDYTRRAGIALALDRYAPSGMVPAEAASAGAALILADIPSFQELWRGCAIFVDPGEPAEIAFAINELADSAGLRQSLGDAARERAALFTHRRRAQAAVALYRRVLRDRRRAAA